MLLADTMAIFFVIIGLLITFPSLWLFCEALFPAWVDESSSAVKHGFIKSLLCGIPVVLAAVFIVAILGKLPGSVGQIAGILSFCLLMLFAQLGVAGFARVLGMRLKNSEKDTTIRVTLRGGAVLVLTFLLPILGWFLILPGSIVIGAGSSIRVFCSRIRATMRSSKKAKAPAVVLSGSEAGLQEP